MNSGRRPAALAALVAAALCGACGGSKRPEATAAPPPAAPAAVAGEPAFVPVPPTEIPTERPAEEAPAEPRPYVVAVDDVLEISVYGDPDLTRTVPVRPDGKISYTFVGDVAAAGRTVEDIRGELKGRLAEYLRTPEVTVIAREFGRQKVYVGGEVRQPGVFYLTPRENTLADVLYRAGLATERADVSRAVLVRRGRLVQVDFGRMVRGDMSGNVPLQNDDLVWVPEASERYIYVLGEVRQPNAIETLIPLSITNLLSRSGGVTPGAAKSREIAVLRGGLKDPRVAVVDFKRLLEGDFSQNILVNPGDIVYVPTTGLGRYNQFIEQILRTFTLLFQGRVVQQGFQ